MLLSLCLCLLCWSHFTFAWAFEAEFVLFVVDGWWVLWPYIFECLTHQSAWYVVVEWVILDNWENSWCDVKRIWNSFGCSSDSLCRKILMCEDFSCYMTQAVVSDRVCVQLCSEVTCMCAYIHSYCTWRGDKGQNFPVCIDVIGCVSSQHHALLSSPHDLSSCVSPPSLTGSTAQACLPWAVGMSMQPRSSPSCVESPR